MAKDAPTNNVPGDFRSLLEKPADSYEAPKPTPEGSFVHLIKGFKFDKSTGEKKTPYVEFALTMIEPLPDVDEAALAEFLNGQSLGEKNVRGATYYLTQDAMYRLGEFLVDHCGCTSGIPTSEQIQEAVGKHFVGHYTQAPSTKDPSKVFSNMDSTSAVPA